MPYPSVDLSKVRTYPLGERQSRVALENLITPQTPVPPFENPELDEIAERIAAARREGRPVLWSIGAHVIKRGLAPLLIDLLERGMITYLASNGAAAIHDFEIALLGATSEDVAASLADGSFGMAEETGALMNRAAKAGARDGLGLGEALGRLIATDGRFHFSQQSVAAAAYRSGVPYTVHVALGTDIIHQHPEADFGVLGWASGQDFKVFARAVCDLEGGVFCNFGSAVIGPEVFLKALSIARNLGNPLRVFTTANFDLVELGDYRAPIGDDQVDYYYRPRKNIVNRPVALGGKGFHIQGDHKVTLPNLYQRILARPGMADLPRPAAAPQSLQSAPLERLKAQAPRAAAILAQVLAVQPDLQPCAAGLGQAFWRLVRCFDTGGTLFICRGLADILPANREPDWGPNQSFRPFRPLPEGVRQRLQALPGGAELAGQLRSGLRLLSLPAGGQAAQELLALARPGDVLLAVNASGRAKTVLQAALAARAINVAVISLSGPGGSPVAGQAEIAVRVPNGATPPGGWALRYFFCKTLFAMLEEHYFGADQ